MAATLDRYRGCLLGLAVGDALGTTLESGGSLDLPLQPWTDDTSMALCLGTSLLAVPGFDALDQMRRYLAWYERGYLSSRGVCFGIGHTTRQALERFRLTGDPWCGSADPRRAGNGSLMRLAPVPMFYGRDRQQGIHWAGESSRTTHGAEECVDACRLLAAMLVAALQGEEKAAILAQPADFLTSPSIQALAQGQYRRKSRDDIHNSGYVVHSLEAALWCFWQSHSFGEAVQLAVSLGGDADTIAAICGQLAGAFYGASGIPGAWLAGLARQELISELAVALFQASQTT
ncbi:MAG: ADP-ribosylglycohydrolase family protein [Thermostichales cyanobacterium BF4_bins_65]